MVHRVGVVGASGYIGAELLRLVAGHPELEVVHVTAGANVTVGGKSVTDILADLKPEAIDVLESIAGFLPAPFGTALNVLLYVVSKSEALKPGSIEEKNYFDKASGDFRDAAGGKADGW